MAGRPKGIPKTGGRKKGTPNKFSGELKEMVLNALSTAGGEDYLVQQAKANPTAFLTLVGKVLPLQVTSPANGGLKLEVSWQRE
jgi:hypothetical protein